MIDSFYLKHQHWLAACGHEYEKFLDSLFEGREKQNVHL